VTKNLHLRLYKITQVQVIEEGDYGRWKVFVTSFCRHNTVLDPKFT
jgi:hypothetical protein